MQFSTSFPFMTISSYWLLSLWSSHLKSVITFFSRINPAHCFLLDFTNYTLLLLPWLYCPLLGLGRFFRFLILYTVGRTPWTVDQPVARPLPTHRTTHTQNKRTQYRHPCLDWNSNPWLQRSSERRQFMPYTARPLWSAVITHGDEYTF
jgi:hypothetical protein